MFQDVQVPQIDGSPVLGFLSHGELASPLVHFQLLELCGVLSAHVAKILKVKPAAVSQWRGGRVKAPGYIRIILAALGSGRLRLLKDFWSNPPDFITKVCAYAEVPLPDNWQSRVEEELQEATKLEAKITAENLRALDWSVYRQAVERMVVLGILKPEDAKKSLAQIDDSENSKKKARDAVRNSLRKQKNKLPVKTKR